MEVGDLPLVLACAVALLSAVGLVLVRRVVHCACLLLVHSLAIAVAYLALSADFMAMGQLTVYSGAIVVLFLFVVLLLPEGGKEPPVGGRRIAVGVFAGATVLTGVVVAAKDLVQTRSAATLPPGDLSVHALARSLFGTQLVPFELTSILLLVAIVAGVAMWSRPSAGNVR